MEIKYTALRGSRETKNSIKIQVGFHDAWAAREWLTETDFGYEVTCDVELADYVKTTKGVDWYKVPGAIYYFPAPTLGNHYARSAFFRGA